MKKILFVCHGNICRSPAAEFIAKMFLKSTNKNHEFMIDSVAVSSEEIGNDIYYPMRQELLRQEIDFGHHFARRITKNDYEEADYIFYMDESNRYFLERMFGKLKANCLPINFFSNDIPDIEDPWYSGRFSLVVEEIQKCIEDIFRNIN